MNKKSYYKRLPISKIEGVTLIILRDILSFYGEKFFQKYEFDRENDKILIKVKRNSCVKNFLKLKLKKV